MTFPQKTARVLMGVLLFLATMPADAGEGVQTGSSLGSENEYAPLVPEDLDALVAPIALYPDNLVAQVLGAATFPDQVTDADSWLKQNSRLTGQHLLRAIDKQSWDPAVKALTQFPSVLGDLAKNLSWTSALGEAAATQQQDVMAAILRMRAKAYAAGNLKSGPQIKVVQESPQTIIIQPANPLVVYVPAYNPTIIYGAPVVVPGYSSSDVAAAAIISFGVGVAVGAMVHGGCCGWGWGGWGTNWRGTTITYNRNVYVSNRYYRVSYHGGYRPGYPAYRPGYPGYRPGYPGYGRPPTYPPGARPPYSPVNSRPRPTPYAPGQGTINHPVNPAYRAKTTPATQPRYAKPLTKTNGMTSSAKPSSNEFRGYQRPQTSSTPAAQTAQTNAFSASAELERKVREGTRVWERTGIEVSQEIGSRERNAFLQGE